MGVVGWQCTNLTPPMKFNAQKLAAKFSSKCQVRCKDFTADQIYVSNFIRQFIRTCL